MPFYGCLPPKVDLRDYKVKASAQQLAGLPNEYELPKYGKVKNQKTVSSCVAHATSSILEWYDKGNHTLSTNFIYGIQNKICDRDHRGMYLKDACKIVKEYGDMLEEDCKGNTEVPMCYSVAESAFDDEEKKERAYEFRLASYYGCDSANDIKYAIKHYGPVLAAIKMYDKYTMATDGTITMDTKSDYEYHGVMIYGWNSTGFLIQNSWGKQWGKDGCMVLPYDQQIAEAKVLVDYVPESETALKTTVINNEFIDNLIKALNNLINLFNTLFKKQ